MNEISLNGESLTFEDVIAVAYGTAERAARCFVR